MSDLTKTPYAGVDRRAPRTTDPKSSPTATAPAKTGGRHSAITNSLYNWHSYKNWADKAKGNFDEKK